MRRTFLTAVLLFGCGTSFEQQRDSPDERRERDTGEAPLTEAPASTTSGRPDTADASSPRKLDAASSRAADAEAPVEPMRPSSARAPRGCDDEEHWIHAIARTGMLLRYDPDRNELTEVGMLACASASSPISMAVRRNGIAYVLYADGTLYEVDTEDASCRETTFAPSLGEFKAFGMGFVSDKPNGDAETLYIVGGDPDDSAASPLATLDTTSWNIATVGALRGTAELTGNAKGELWAFLATGSPMAVLELDKNSGTTLRSFDVSAIDRTSSASAWAFAYWGGRYYIFYEGRQASSTSIYRLTPELDVVEPVYEQTGYRIVGAGVSTCAPILLI